MCSPSSRWQRRSSASAPSGWAGTPGGRGGGGGVRCHDVPQQRGRGGGDAGAMWRVLQEEMVPVRMLPVFVWKASDSADDVLASAEAFVHCLAASVRRYAAVAAATAGGVGEGGAGGGDGEPAGWMRGEAPRKRACEAWSRALGVVLVCVADGAASGEGSGSSGGSGGSGCGGGGHAGCDPGVVLQYFRRLGRGDAAARREGSDCEVGGEAHGLDRVGADRMSSGVYVRARVRARVMWHMCRRLYTHTWCMYVCVCVCAWRSVLASARVFHRTCARADMCTRYIHVYMRLRMAQPAAARRCTGTRGKGRRPPPA